MQHQQLWEIDKWRRDTLVQASFLSMRHLQSLLESSQPSVCSSARHTVGLEACSSLTWWNLLTRILLFAYVLQDPLEMSYSNVT